MKQPPFLLKLTVLTSSLLLGGGFVSYYSGTFNSLIKPNAKQPGETFIGGSKSKVMIAPASLDTSDNQPAAKQPEPTLMGGSKSMDFTGILNPVTAAPPKIPSVIDVPSDPPSATPQQPPANTAPAKPTIMFGPKAPFRSIDLPMNDPQPIPPPGSSQPPKPDP